jgi:uncharacterized protein YjiS (DUF1127 family)
MWIAISTTRVVWSAKPRSDGIDPDDRSVSRPETAVMKIRQNVRHWAAKKALTMNSYVAALDAGFTEAEAREVTAVPARKPTAFSRVEEARKR